MFGFCRPWVPREREADRQREWEGGEGGGEGGEGGLGTSQAETQEERHFAGRLGETRGERAWRGTSCLLQTHLHIYYFKFALSICLHKLVQSFPPLLFVTTLRSLIKEKLNMGETVECCSFVAKNERDRKRFLGNFYYQLSSSKLKLIRNILQSFSSIWL